MAQKKMGRPPVDNKKDVALHVRLDDETAHILNLYASQENISKGEAIRRSIRMLAERLK